jgi:amino acid transporter
MSMMDDLIELGIGAIIAATFMGSAISTLISTNTTDWGATNIAIWSLLPILAILAVGISFVDVVRRHRHQG